VRQVLQSVQGRVDGSALASCLATTGTVSQPQQDVMMHVNILVQNWAIGLQGSPARHSCGNDRCD
jgi:hypothetical protein